MSSWFSSCDDDAPLIAQRQPPQAAKAGFAEALLVTTASTAAPHTTAPKNPHWYIALDVQLYTCLPGMDYRYSELYSVSDRAMLLRWLSPTPRPRRSVSSFLSDPFDD